MFLTYNETMARHCIPEKSLRVVSNCACTSRPMTGCHGRAFVLAERAAVLLKLLCSHRTWRHVHTEACDVYGNGVDVRASANLVSRSIGGMG